MNVTLDSNRLPTLQTKIPHFISDQLGWIPVTIHILSDHSLYNPYQKERATGIKYN
jgi:hypothetical protein